MTLQLPLSELPLPGFWQRALQPERLRALAGEAAYLRGELYAANGRVRKIEFSDQQLTAQVVGTAIYEVRLWQRHNQLQSDCTCPSAAEGAFCKHCVAVALVCGTPS